MIAESRIWVKVDNKDSLEEPKDYKSFLASSLQPFDKLVEKYIKNKDVFNWEELAKVLK